MKEDVAYQNWLKEIEGKLPEDIRENFKAVTTSDAGKELFRGVSRREDYNRRVNEVEAERQRLTGWWNDEKPKNERLAAELARKDERISNYERTLKELGLLDGAPTPGGQSPAAAVVKKEDLDQVEKKWAERVAQIDRAFPSVIGEISEVIYKSAKEGYNVSPKEVIAHALENNIPIPQAFSTLTEVEREKRSADALEKERAKWKEEGRKEALSKLSTPAQIRPAGPTILDTLRDKDFHSDSNSRVSAAMKDFMDGDWSKSQGSGLV